VKQTEEIWTPLKILAWTTGYLAEKGVENARREAEWLLCEVTGLDRVGLYLNFDRPLQEKELSAYRLLVARRGKREPLQYILKNQEFDGLLFEVSPAVLIPRHDTWTLIEEALNRSVPNGSILDIGTGSGCIAITLAKRLPDASVTAVDLSADALVVAARNAAEHNVDIEFLHGSFFQPVNGRRFNLIVSNPPYIRTADLPGLQPEVRDYEPQMALDGGLDGLDAYRHLIAEAPDYLMPGGYILFEVGFEQADLVTSILEQNGFDTITPVPDGAGILRVAGGVWHAA